jgi:hypothetical protein
MAANVSYMNLGAGILHTGVALGLTGWAVSSFDNSKNGIDTSLHTIVPDPGDDDLPTDENVRPTFRIDENIPTSTLSIVIGSIMFVAITAIFHFVIYALRKSYYAKALDNENNSLRWAEYAITSTIMMSIIGFTVGLKTFNAMLLILVSNVVLMSLGDLIEKSKTDARYTAIALTVIGWVLMLVNFSVLGQAFYYTMNEVPGVPSFVPAVFITMLILFGSFGVIQLLFLGDKIDFVKSEYLYTVLSFVSKTLLVLLVFSGAMAR